MTFEHTLLSPIQEKIIAATKGLLPDIYIEVGSALTPLVRGFRGKQGKAIAAVYPHSITAVYQLIKCYTDMKVGYILQGANTALKGQGTPNGEEKDIVIIKTSKLTQIKVLDIPNNNEYKILLVQPGVALKEAEIILNQINFSLPHRTGSHDLGNTFGGSVASACGGVQVDNRDGRPSTTCTGNMGLIAISVTGVIYNGFIKAEKFSSGEALLKYIDNNQVTFEDIELPHINEVDEFLKKLFIDRSYPIRNHRGEIIFPGDGGEGSQAVVYQMYLIRKKPTEIRTYAMLLFSNNIKEKFYKEVIFSEGAENPHSLPILCESMNEKLTKIIVNEGHGFFMGVLFATGWKWVSKYLLQLMRFRNNLLNISPVNYIKFEAFLGKCFSYIFTPRSIRTKHFQEILFIEVANHENEKNNIALFDKKLQEFSQQHAKEMQIINIPPNCFSERMILQTRTVATPAILSLTIQEKGTLFPYDDALMPGKMTNEYKKLLGDRIKQGFPSFKLLGPYFYGHDLKQISHNEWLLIGNITSEQEKEINHIQLETIREVGGFPHAEHGVGDHADTDLCREELVKLVAHRLLNDIDGLANPGGGPERAFKKACADKSIVEDAITLARKILAQEKIKGTLLIWEGKIVDTLSTQLEKNIVNLITSV